MKTQVAPYGTSTICLRIVCANGTTIRVTRHPKDLLMSNGQIYQTGSGFDFTGYEATASLSPSAIDLDGILGFAGVTKEAVASGVFDGARAYLFATNFLSPVEDYEPIVASFLGKATLTDDGYRFEEMALIDALNQTTGDTYSAGCKKRFGGQEWAGCKVDLAPLTVTGALSHVSGTQIFRDSTRTEAADYFAYGTIAITSGGNAGLKAMEIKRYEADGTIELFEPFYYLPTVGDTYTLIPGCRKRIADCRDKWNNILNFGGFPDVPTSSVYSSRGTN
ncbi:MAG TPA: phage BR0599 family protein [Accumulibacter sp.]|nr:phage BR0599 family protein [Accumulibacter sp.]